MGQKQNAQLSESFCPNVVQNPPFGWFCTTLEQNQLCIFFFEKPIAHWAGWFYPEEQADWAEVLTDYFSKQIVVRSVSDADLSEIANTDVVVGSFDQYFVVDFRAVAFGAPYKKFALFPVEKHG